MSYLKSVQAYHRLHIQPLLGAPQGCESSEIETLEASLGFAVPEAYREFLIWMGRDFDGIFRGSDCFHTHVLDNNEWLPELLAENTVDSPLPERYVAFFVHQGYNAAWFEIPASADPECLFFAEGQTDEPEDQGPFSSFLLGEMKALVPSIEGILGREVE